MVIAIIALLMSILMVAPERAKTQAKEAIGISDLHEWGIIFTMYATEHNTHFTHGNVGGDEMTSR